MNKYRDEFTCVEDINAQFDIPDDQRLKNEEVLYATYTYEDYEGSAYVLFQRDGKLYEVHGGHCSCYGLEGQWEPDETMWEALGDRAYLGDDFVALVAARGGPTHSDSKVS